MLTHIHTYIHTSPLSIMGEREEQGIVPQFSKELYDRIQGTSDNQVCSSVAASFPLTRSLPSHLCPSLPHPLLPHPLPSLSPSPLLSLLHPCSLPFTPCSLIPCLPSLLHPCSLPFTPCSLTPCSLIPCLPFPLSFTLAPSPSPLAPSPHAPSSLASPSLSPSPLLPHPMLPHPLPPLPSLLHPCSLPSFSTDHIQCPSELLRDLQ